MGDNTDKPDVGEIPPARQGVRQEVASASGAPSDAAARALAEAEARRAEVDRREAELEARREEGGRGGLDPVRYRDWEIAGRAVDF